MEKPYVGIKGFTTRTEVERVLTAAPKFSHAVMVGMLMNQYVLAHKQVPHPKRYPDIRRLGEIFISHPQALNMVCYQSIALDSLFDQLSEIRERVGPCLQGFQLDLIEPPMSALERIRHAWPELKLSLRINREMFRRSMHRPVALANTVSGYAGLLDYAFVDFTNGDGVPCSPDLLRSILSYMRQADIPFRLGIGGGLGVYTLSPLKALLRELPDLCLDADFRLRNDDDELDLEASGEFLNRAARLLAAD
ncbi:hypothetical protein HZC53_03740 [Candidatus Uhrbacteria bacterium]|nr:hypothetical protein [Candidatus Uhrbacteria bacterium]